MIEGFSHCSIQNGFDVQKGWRIAVDIVA